MEVGWSWVRGRTVFVRPGRGRGVRTKTNLNSVQDRRVKDVDTSVDTVSDKFLGLLHKAIDGAAAGDGENDTKLGGLIDLGDLHQM